VVGPRLAHTSFRRGSTIGQRTANACFGLKSFVIPQSRVQEVARTANNCARSESIAGPSAANGGIPAWVFLLAAWSAFHSSTASRFRVPSQCLGNVRLPFHSVGGRARTGMQTSVVHWSMPGWTLRFFRIMPLGLSVARCKAANNHTHCSELRDELCSRSQPVRFSACTLA
jgi:hypothetical protein